jgi:FKBP-type peptidyl-prolyl cis-trans isomerase 2
MAIKKGDFIEVEYTGKTEGQVFDSTSEAVAKEAGLNPKATYKPAIICIGEGQLLKGLDEFLEGKELGKHTVTVPPEKAFGKKDAKLLKLIPASKFKAAKIQPFVGMEVNVDNHYGVVRSISGGRITVDFNHPLASKELTYEVEVKRMVEKPEEQVASLLDNIGVHHHGTTMEGEEARRHQGARTAS